ncbi:MAG: diaminopimelate epimerase [Bacteroidota bacterium]
MEISFYKYQGTGNDFILLDDRSEQFPASKELVQKLCDRRFGIGADGLILIQNHPQHDYRMVYFNSDGSQSLCGNGSRCGFAFARFLKMVDQKAIFETTDGVHQVKLEGGIIRFQLSDVEMPSKISDREYFLNTGSPHHIVICDEVETIDVLSEGSAIRNSSAYTGQNGTNVNFAQLLPDRVKMRTYERGVEGETLSCGTGATAVGLLAGAQGMESPVNIETLGGNLKVYFQKKTEIYTQVWLAGPAEMVFKGTLNIATLRTKQTNFKGY